MGLRYQYVVEGLAANLQTWKHEGEIDLPHPGMFLELPDIVTKESFIAMTNGRAVYGRPGEGCKGPYEITRLEIKVKEGA